MLTQTPERELNLASRLCTMSEETLSTIHRKSSTQENLKTTEAGDLMATLGVGLLKLLATLIQVSRPETPRLYGTEFLKTKNFGFPFG